MTEPTDHQLAAIAELNDVGPEDVTDRMIRVYADDLRRIEAERRWDAKKEMGEI